MGIQLTAQSSGIAGEYYLKWECDSHQIEYKLSLEESGDYELNTYTKDLSGQDDVVHNSEKGTWNMKENTLLFSSKFRKDFDEEYTVDLNGSVARFIVETPSDNTEKKGSNCTYF